MARFGTPFDMQPNAGYTASIRSAAALNRSGLAVHEQTAEARAAHDREGIYRAIRLRPLMATLLSLAEIRTRAEGMFASDQRRISF